MDCRKAQYYIRQRLDQLLSEEDNAALEQHLACCEACAGELALQERLSMTLRELGREEIQARGFEFSNYEQSQATAAQRPGLAARSLAQDRGRGGYPDVAGRRVGRRYERAESGR